MARLASGGKGNGVKIWRAADGKLLRELTGSGDSVTHAAFHPHSTDLAVISGSVLQIWDSETGQSRPLCAQVAVRLSLCSTAPTEAASSPPTSTAISRSGRPVRAACSPPCRRPTKRFLAVLFSPMAGQIFSGQFGWSGPPLRGRCDGADTGRDRHPGELSSVCPLPAPATGPARPCLSAD